MGLMAEAVNLDGGGVYVPSHFQSWLYARWKDFWEWVEVVTGGEPWDLVVNGDALDGVHHNSTTQISHNLADQAAIARDLLGPVVKKSAAYYHIRGTEAHVGRSGAEEERLAHELGAIPDDDGNFARWEMWHKMAGPNDPVVHLTHHISTSGSSYAEVGAIGRELVEMQVNKGRWDANGADMLVRSHRHRCGEVAIYGARGRQTSVVTPGWQGKTPFVYRINARMAVPQFGGIVIVSDEDGLTVRSKVWALPKEGS